MAGEAQTAFISYSREDSEFVLKLAQDLKAAGAAVWLDQLDIAPGHRWARAVEDALHACPRMLVILSPASVGSRNVEDEVSFALDESKTVIPVLYRDCKIPFRLRPFHYADFTGKYDFALKRLLSALPVAPSPERTPPRPQANPLKSGGIWTKQDSGVDQDLYSVTFLDRQRGWVAGDSGTILHTEDGGRSWRR